MGATISILGLPICDCNSQRVMINADDVAEEHYIIHTHQHKPHSTLGYM